MKEDPSASRRGFLRNFGFGFGGGVLRVGGMLGKLEKIAEAAQNLDRKVGFALVGLGSLATNQIGPALLKSKYCSLAAVVSSDPQKLQRWSTQYKLPENCLYSYETFDQIAYNSAVDVVYILLPNSMHSEFTVRAAHAGKHVLCEKPMEVSVEKCERMIEACQSAGKQLAIGYRCQFEPHHLEMIRLARQQVYGPVRLIEASFGFRLEGAEQWRLKRELAGGGALMDVGIYALQGARYLAGEEPIEVTAHETKSDPEKFSEVDESIFWTLKFPSGLIANCATTYLVPGMNRLWAGADQGSFELTSAFGYDGQKGQTHKGPFSFPATDHFAVQMDDFAQCLATGKKSKVSGEEGLRDVKIITAIYESIKLGGQPVQLS